MRRVENPPNPYLSEHRERLGPPPGAALEVYEEHARSILAENESPDIGFRYSVNPYRGCQHACAYCYARRTHEYLGLGAGTDFETRISAKVNAPELLDAALRRPSWQREEIAFSGVTDCYQPLEAVYQLTRRCLEVCRAHGNPVGVVTKSRLVARDADVLAAIHAAAGAHVYFSIPFACPETARAIEPHAPPPAKRFEAMRQLAAAGVPVGVLVAPVIPGLSDREIPAVLAQAAACGAQSAGFQPLRLPGSVAPVFMRRLREAVPDTAARVEAHVRAMRDGNLNDPRFGWRMRGSGAYWESIARLFEISAARYGLNCGLDYQKKQRTPSVPTVRQLHLF